jgi:hypothetical protein
VFSLFEHRTAPFDEPRCRAGSLAGTIGASRTSSNAASANAVTWPGGNTVILAENDSNDRKITVGACIIISTSEGWQRQWQWQWQPTAVRNGGVALG